MVELQEEEDRKEVCHFRIHVVFLPRPHVGDNGTESILLLPHIPRKKRECLNQKGGWFPSSDTLPVDGY